MPGPDPDRGEPGATLLHRLSVAALVGLATTLLRMLHWSWRKDLTELGRIDALRQNGQSAVVAFWHGDYLPLFSLVNGRQSLVLVAPGFRGDVISGICVAFGNRPVLLNGSRMNILHHAVERALADGATLVSVAADGPIGPRHEPKPGILRLASEFSLPILPMGITCWPRLVFAGRWDRMQLPLPFARVTVHVGEPMHLPHLADAQELDAARSDLARRLLAEGCG